MTFSKTSEPELRIRQQKVVASISGQECQMSLTKFLDYVRPNHVTGVLPDGVKAVYNHPQAQAVVWLSQMSPRVHRFQWISEDSPVDSGFSGVRYRPVQVALPFVICFTVFSMQALANGKQGLAHERKRAEIFISPTPVRDEQTPLYYAPLYNVSRYQQHVAAKRPLAWLCTTSVHELYSPDAFGSDDPHKRMVAGHEALMRVIYQSYNRSSESAWAASQGEAGSWFSEYQRRGIKPFTSIREWEAKTAEDPLFVLNTELIPAPTVGEVVHRIMTQTLDLPPQPPVNAAWLARLVFNNSEPTAP